jgi:two-component system phosphate regulon sensor histidine kinase PhoR
MNKKLRYIFWAALLSCTGIIASQLYWLYNAFRVNEDNFTKVASTALQRSIEQYLFKETFSLTHDNPSLVYFAMPKDTMTLRPDNAAALKDTLMKRGMVTLGSYRSMISDSEAMKMSQVVLAGYLPGSVATEIQPDSLLRMYQHELAKNDINIQVRLVWHDSSLHKIAAYAGPTENKNRVGAYFDHQQQYLLKQTIIPILISSLLMLLTAGCIRYMWRVILQQKQLNDIKNDFINNMTHELRTPISILKTTHEALYHFGEVRDPEKTMRYLKANTEELNKLENNVERILNIASYEQGNKVSVPESISLKALIEEVIHRFAISAVITLAYNLPVQFITTDKYAIETILVNLLDNAIKYAGKEIIITISQLDSGWQLSMKDNGSGIPAQQIPFIFDKFFRVPTGNLHNVKGYGLGLSYVKELVKLLHGSISVQSKQGMGTTFTIQFPLVWIK